jgi:hypothetical protein
MNNFFSVDGVWMTKELNFVLYVAVLISHIDGQNKCWHIVGEDALI